MSEIRVIYVLGYGRSGSTMLNALLGKHPQVESYGEIRNLHAVAAANELCSCHERVADCPFWQEVWERWRDQAGDELAGYDQLQERVERLQRLPKLMLSSVVGTAELARYGRVTRALFEALAAASGQRVIVDSSKYPGRAYALTQVPGLDLRLIHLVRDARGVAYSRLKSFKKDLEAGLQNEIAPVSAGRTARSWLALNLVSSFVMSRYDRSRRLRVLYEDVVGSPGETLDGIGRLADLDMTPVKEALARDEAFGFGHTAAGNRVRMAGSLRLRPDLAWTENLPEAERRLTWRICGLLMRRYGYRKQVGAR